MGSKLSDWALLNVIRVQSRVKRLQARGRDQQGAITIEYILIIALIAIIIITLFTILLWPVLRPALENLIERIRGAIAGDGIT
jgi:Flp pilus assembly pilin Flp